MCGCEGNKQRQCYNNIKRLACIYAKAEGVIVEVYFLGSWNFSIPEAVPDKATAREFVHPLQ